MSQNRHKLHICSIYANVHISVGFSQQKIRTFFQSFNLRFKLIPMNNCNKLFAMNVVCFGNECVFETLK